MWNYSANHIGLLREWTNLIDIKHSEQCLDYSKCSINPSGGSNGDKNYPEKKTDVYSGQEMDSEHERLLNPLDQTELDKHPTSGLFSNMNS